MCSENLTYWSSLYSIWSGKYFELRKECKDFDKLVTKLT